MADLMPAEATTSTLVVLSRHQINSYFSVKVSAILQLKIYYLSKKVSDFTTIL